MKTFSPRQLNTHWWVCEAVPQYAIERLCGFISTQTYWSCFQVWVDYFSLSYSQVWVDYLKHTHTHIGKPTNVKG